MDIIFLGFNSFKNMLCGKYISQNVGIRTCSVVNSMQTATALCSNTNSAAQATEKQDPGKGGQNSSAVNISFFLFYLKFFIVKKEGIVWEVHHVSKPMDLSLKV